MAETDVLGTAVVEVRAALDKLKGDLADAKRVVDKALDRKAQVELRANGDKAVTESKRVAKAIAELKDKSVDIKANTAGADASLKRVKDSSGDAERGMRSTNKASGVLTGGLGLLTKAAGGLGIAMLAKNLVADAWEGLTRSAAATGQLESGLRSTGNAANTTVVGMEAYAGALERVTGMEAEATMEGQALLQTFTNVRNEAGLGNDVFNRATEAALDLSAKGFGGVTDASKMLGKALNDPIKGISALGRAGVTFSDEQKAMIASLVETGDTLGAQKIILGELEKQVGGAAAAYGETLPGKVARANAAVGEITENLLASAAPALETVAGGVLNLVTKLNLLDSVDLELPDELLEAGSLARATSVDMELLNKTLARGDDRWSNLKTLASDGLSGLAAGRDEVSELDYALNQLVSNGNAETANRLFMELAAEQKALGVDMYDFHGRFPQYKEAWNEYQASLEGIPKAEQDASAAIEKVTTEVEMLAEEVGTATTELDALFGRFMDADQAAIASREAIAGVREELDDLVVSERDVIRAQLDVTSAQESLDEKRKDGTTTALELRDAELAVRDAQTALDEVQRNALGPSTDDLRSIVIDAIGTFEAEATALGLVGQGTEDVAGRSAFLRQRLEELREKYPELRAEIDTYIARLNEVPGSKTTTIHLDTISATESLNRMRAALEDLYDTPIPGPALKGGLISQGGGAMFAGDMPGMAKGGRVTRSGFALVGEEGPEIRWLNAANAIQPLDQVATSGGSGGDTYDIDIHNPRAEAPSTSLPRVLRRARYLSRT